MSILKAFDTNTSLPSNIIPSSTEYYSFFLIWADVGGEKKIFL